MFKIKRVQSVKILNLNRTKETIRCNQHKQQ